MDSILDFDKELDLPFLDKVVTSFYHGSGPDVYSLSLVSAFPLAPKVVGFVANKNRSTNSLNAF